jgi:UDP-N-acetyl-D-mannosaminuronate dehydrogenase
LFPKNESSNMARVLRRSLNEAIEGADCVVVLSGQDQFKRLNLKKLRAVMRMPAAIVDLTGIIEPQRVEKEGFLYRGLGRGVDKK